MRLKKYKFVLFIMTMMTLFGCAPTEEEKKQAEEEEKNKPSLSIQPVSALTEPDEGAESYLATVIMSKTIEDNVTVHYSLNPKTATGDDFQAKSGVLTIPSGSNSATIELIILADNIDEQDEEFTITLSSPTNAKLGIASETVVIQDSELDAEPVITIEIEGALQEPDSGSHTYLAIVKLSSFTSFPVSVAYSLDSDTATAGSDFESSVGALSFDPGTNSAEIELVINADNIDEFDENFIITLSKPINAQIADATATVTIIDSEEDVATLSFASDSAIVAEGLGEYKVEVLLSHASEKGVSISFTTSGVAVKGLDYKIVTEGFIPVYGKTAEIIINFLSDSILEGGESLILQLEPIENAILGDKTEFVFTIPSEVGLNDTGITSWYDGSSLSTDPKDSSPDYPGQDADFGHDRDSNSNVEPNGFDFTPLDIDGNRSALGGGARCMQDNRTGLVFELKMEEETTLPILNDEDLEELFNKGGNPYPAAHANWQANNYRYTWFTSDITNDAGVPGFKEVFVHDDYPISRVCAFPIDSADNVNSCTTEAYTHAINSSNLCGFTDWKLPTIEQLRSIYNYQGVFTSSINADYFPNMNDGNYLSLTSSAFQTGSTMCISGSTGQVKLCNKNSLYYIRMVRGGVE
ncbi:Calx-beta domain-containing protein [Moritella marina]|uniref:Calx-beta domain-containing protein n=1 Tax=Moritella marina TaxID=90736 RepID=UPI0037037E18